MAEPLASGGALDHDYLQLITLKPSPRVAMFRYVISAIFRGAGPGIEEPLGPGRICPRAVCPLPRDRHQPDSSPAHASRWRGVEWPAGRNVHRAACADAADAAVIVI